MKEAKKRISEKDNFTYLLFSLIFSLFSSASVAQFFARSFLGQSLVITLTVISMSIGIWSLRSSRLIFNSALVLTLATIIITVLVTLLDRAELELIMIKKTGLKLNVL